MDAKGYRKTISIKAPIENVYEAITTAEGLSSWWTKLAELEGQRATFRFDEGTTYAVMQIERQIPNKEVVWRCSEQYFVIEGSEKTNEWVGTVIWFELSENPDKSTALEFTHEGLVPTLDCYKICEQGWDYFLKKLRQYLQG